MFRGKERYSSSLAQKEPYSTKPHEKNDIAHLSCDDICRPCDVAARRRTLEPLHHLYITYSSTVEPRYNDDIAIARVSL